MRIVSRVTTFPENLENLEMLWNMTAVTEMSENNLIRENGYC